MISTSENLPEHSADPDARESGAIEPESKSQRKRQAEQITDLARQLVEMKPRVLASLPIEPDIRDAIKHCANIRAHGARKRQLHFVSKLLRKSDNVEELKSRLTNPDGSHSAVPCGNGQSGNRKDKSGQPGNPVLTEQQTNPHLEFRDKLLEDFANMVEPLREKYPDIELQQVRQLVRNAQSEYKKAQAAIDATDSSAETSPTSTKAAKSLLKLLVAGS